MRERYSGERTEECRRALTERLEECRSEPSERLEGCQRKAKEKPERKTSFQPPYRNNSGPQLASALRVGTTCIASQAIACSAPQCPHKMLMRGRIAGLKQAKMLGAQAWLLDQNSTI